MLVYSKRINKFINEIKTAIKQILSKEVGLRVSGERFWDRLENTSYSITVVIYNNKNMLGYFDSDFYELGFNARLMHVTSEQLYDIVRHELAHYITFINYGNLVQSHGPEFRAFCLKMGWGEGVSKATTCIESEQGPSVILTENSVLRKVQKLMALSNSGNKNEAEQAMIKSQQLLLKHNIEANYIDDEEEEKIFLKRIIKQKKRDSKMRAIASILKTFFVSTIYNRVGGYMYLEILGSAVNVEIAEYVADVLKRELDQLWEEAKEQANLKGLVAKNSFFIGVARGYCNKIDAFKKTYDSEITSALIVLEKKLKEGVSLAYPSLRSSKSSGRYCPESSKLGEKMGREMSINPGISKSQNSGTTIAYSGR